MKGVVSDLLSVLCGVTQGSVLGPLLFLIYTNDLANASKLALCLFADDTYLSITNKSLQNLENICNTEIASVDEWFKANKLTANSKKASKFILSKGGGQIGHLISN